MSAPSSPNDRVRVEGKFFRLSGAKFFVKGVTYGPFAPNAAGDTFPPHEIAARDFAQIRELGANVLRVYYVPPRWLLDLAAEHGLKLFIDIPWEKHRCFLESYEMREAARGCVRAAVTACKDHPAVFAYSIANEIPAEIVRWHGAKGVAAFLDELVDEVKAIDRAALCTFSSFPPTEFLQPKKIDFVTFNVYLHERASFENYLARLQTLANENPLVLGEFGIDSIREGEERKCEWLDWQIESAFRAGLAGTVLFSFTDDWFRGGQQITGWGFGLTTRERTPKMSFAVVQSRYRAAPYWRFDRAPRVSVVVASYNGASTLRACLESLTRLNYPDYEVILVDDGSTDSTQQIVTSFPSVRNLRQANLGLSAARNAGIAAVSGEIVAFTDSDCRADEDWLHYLVGDLLRSNFAGIGGHNFLPPDDSPIAAAVLVSPGGPSHVMLTDHEAEHIPGCNMAFYKWALDEIHSFDPMFRKAGDDVDVCWRLRERGYKIGFSPAGFVWHYRRSTVKAYLRQQSGYGEAEALLAQKHPEYFSAMGGGIWRGRIYGAVPPGIVLQRAVIYHGILGSGFFQKIYQREPSLALMLCTSLAFHVTLTLPLLLLASWIPTLWPLPVATALISASVCVVASIQAPLPDDKRHPWSRALIALLYFLQPIVRGWARYKQRVNPPQSSRLRREVSSTGSHELPVGFWSKNGVGRYEFLQKLQVIVEARGWANKWDSGWNDFDLEIASRWSSNRIVTAAEELENGKQFLRCRVQARWSWLSAILFTLSAVAALSLPLYFANQFPWTWMALSALPFVYLLIENQEASQSMLLVEVVNDAAETLKLEPFEAAP